MATLGIKEAFARYGVTLRNVQWSVSGWASDGALVVSMWEHHATVPPPVGVLEFTGSVNRWQGPGNTEFRENIAKAYEAQSRVRLIVVNAINRADLAVVESGVDASTVKKDFDVRDELVGKVTEWNGDRYAVQFKKA